MIPEEQVDEEQLYNTLTTIAMAIIILHLISAAFTGWFILSYFYHVRFLDRFGMMLMPVWALCCMLMPMTMAWAWYCWVRSRLAPGFLPAMLALTTPVVCYTIPALWIFKAIILEALKLTP